MIYLLLLLFIGLQLHSTTEAVDTQAKAQRINRESITDVLKEKLTSECSPETFKNFELEYITFDYKATPLVDIINKISAEKKINVILPQGDQALNQKITYHIDGKLTVEQAWRELNTILEYSGYTWSAEQNGHIQLLKVVKSPTESIAREPLPLYINPPLEDIPNNEEIIKAVFYLSNLKIDDDKVQKSLINTILTGNAGMLSPTATVIPIAKQNGLLIIDKAQNIQSAMQIIQSLDLSGIPDAIEVVPLYYTQANFVSALFNTEILKTTNSNPAGFPTPRQSEDAQATYFPKNTRVAPLIRTNAIVIMGTTKGIRTVKDFIIKYIDHPLESGDSILHVYDLQYLNAEDFSGVLTKLVKGVTSSGQSEGEKKGEGFERDFKGVIIRSEKTTIESILTGRKEDSKIDPSQASQGGETAAGMQEGVETGGNRLIIAATKKDWKRIKDLIIKLDKPQPQVALEVLVVDLVLTGDKALGSQLRNQSGANDAFSKDINFQTAHLGEPVLREPGPALDVDSPGGGSIPNFPANALMANLLQFVDNTTSNLANQQANGSTVISIRDPNSSGIWNIWQILDRNTNAVLLAQPFITTLDNQQATITLSQDRLLIGGAGSAGGAVTIHNNYVSASTAIDILPRISLENDNINLDIVINVNEFIDNTSNPDGSTPNNTRITRLVQTNANVGNNEILAIGGLIRFRDSSEVRETPLLGRVPVLGWFFKRKGQVKEKNNLMVFITPTIIEPRKGGGVGKYTSKKLCKSEHEIDQSVNFQSLRDPITRWFFQPDVGYGKRVVTDFVEQKVFDESTEKPITLVKNDSEALHKYTTEKIVVAKNNQAKKASSSRIHQLASNEENPLVGRKRGKDQRVLNT